MDSFTPIRAYTEASMAGQRSIPVVTASSVGSLKTSEDSGNNPSASMQNGQKFTGEVIDLKNDEITVRLNNDSTITAKVPERSVVNIGDITTFKVSKNGADIILEPLTSDATNEDTIIDKALAAAGLPRNLKNVTITQELLHNNMSIDKQSIVNILTQSFANKDVSISTLVAMNKMGMEVTPDSATAMENYRTGEHRIIALIDSIANSIEGSIKESSNPNTVLNLNSIYTKLIETSNSGNQMNVLGNETLLQSTFTSAEDGKNIINILNIFGNNSELEAKINDGTATLRETALAINKAYEQATVMDLENSYTGTNFTTNNGVSFLSSAKALFMNPSIENVLKNYSLMQNNNNELSSYMNDLGRATINSMIKGLPGSQALSYDIWNGNISSKDLLNNLNSIMNFMSNENAADLVKSNEYLAVLKQAITSEWTITPQELTEDKVKEKYDTMYNQLEKLASSVADVTGESAGKVASNSNALKSNINFMNTLNEMFSYVQLPIRMNGQNVHSELYVMTNKKKLAKDNSNISVLLHLDMDNLKPLDVNITLNDNNVNAKFYMSDEASMKLVETNLEHLELNLLEKGFVFKGKVYNQREDNDLVKKFIDTGNTNSTPIKRYSFDIRM